MSVRDYGPFPFTCPRCGQTHEAMRATLGCCYTATCGEDTVTIKTAWPGPPEVALESGEFEFIPPQPMPPPGRAWF